MNLFILLVHECFSYFVFFQISEHIEGAIVYLDAGSTESFQFIGAYPILLDLGARAICSLESMSVLDAVSIRFHMLPKLSFCAYSKLQDLIIIERLVFVYLKKLRILLFACFLKRLYHMLLEGMNIGW